jgi:heme-degrading monooxygenase HmoA
VPRVCRGNGKIAQDMPFAAVFLYEVEPDGHDAFAAVYGPDGDWARFFAAGEGYLGTELLRADGRYLLIDRWSTRAAYEAFLAAHADEYARRNEAAKRLWADERDLGRFQSA